VLAKRLEREFGRFDVDLLDSSEYVNMPARIRNHAYLFLLVLNGWSRKHRTDGLVPAKVAKELARRMGQDLAKLIQSLTEVSMISDQNGDVLVTKYDKWQETKAEIEARQEANRTRQTKHRNALVTRDSRVSHGTEIEKEREIEKEISISTLETLTRPLTAQGKEPDDPELRRRMVWI